jgi:hypothetical protein
MALRFLPVVSGRVTLPVTQQSPILHFMPNRNFVSSHDWDFQMVNRGHVNNEGWVNDQDYRVSEEPPLLAVVGDSFVEAAMVPYAKTFHGILAKSLEGRLRVYSFAASGAPLSQYVVWAQYAVNKFKARALIINVVGNDFDESRIEYKSAPGFWYYAPSRDGNLSLQLVEYRPTALSVLVGRSALLRYLLFNLHALYPAQLMNLLHGRRDRKETMPYAGFTNADASPQRVAAAKAAVDAALRDIGAIGLPPECIALTVDGSRYPAQSEQNRGTFFEVMRRYLLERATAAGYEAIDLDRFFLPRYAKTGERFEFPNDGHWNANGHRVAAEALSASRLLNSGCRLQLANTNEQASGL